MDALDSAYCSVDGVLFNKSQTTLIQCPGAKTGTYTVPNSVSFIGIFAFCGCTSLTNVMIGNSVTNIPEGAFCGCTNLTTVTIGNSVTNIEGRGWWPGAFDGCTSLTSITIPNSVTFIGSGAFGGCTRLTAIMVDALNAVYSSVDGVLFDKGQTTLILCPGGRAGSYTIPSSVTSIVAGAFSGCTSLISLAIPNSVTEIGDYAFQYCASLTGVYFKGNAPGVGPDAFDPDNNPTVYYLPGTTGWGPTFAGRPTALWLLANPLILSSGPNFGVQTNSFGFIISWATNLSVVVEASTDLANPTWIPLATNTLTSGSAYFSDPQWTNYPGRFYRLRWP